MTLGEGCHSFLKVCYFLSVDCGIKVAINLSKLLQYEDWLLPTVTNLKRHSNNLTES